MVVTSK